VSVQEKPAKKTAKKPAEKTAYKKSAKPETEREKQQNSQNADAQVKLSQAIEAGRERNYAKAAQILEELLSGFDAPAEAYLYMGRALHALKNYPRALASFNDYIRLMPDSPAGYLFAGRSCISMGLAQRAVPLLRKARSLNPEDTIIQALLGTAYLKSKRSQLAADTFQEVVEAAAAKGLPQNLQARLYRAYINALFIRGINLCRTENYELGGQMLRFVLENGGDGPLLRLELGRACRELGEMPEALEHYTKAAAFNPADLRIRWYRSSVLMAMGEQQQALREIDEIRSLDSGLPDLPWNSRLVDLYTIRSFLETGEWRRAADLCRQWLKQNGPDPLIHAMFAEALRNLKNFDFALNHLERAVEIDPDNIQLWYERILIAWEAENWKALEKALRVIGRISANDDFFRRFSVLLEAKTGEDDKEVIALLQKAILELGPEPELMYALGERYLKIGLADLALNWFKKTIVVQENHERSWLGKIAALEALSLEIRSEPSSGKGLLSTAERRIRYTEQLSAELRQSYDRYVSLWPDNFSLRRERAHYLLHSSEYGEAVKELESLLAWDPSNPGLRRVLSYAYRKTGRFREAAVYLKSLLKEKPGDVEVLLEYSGCLQRCGASIYAVGVLEKARVFLEKNIEIPIALGLLYFKERNFEKAFDLLKEAAALDKGDPRPYSWMAALAAKKGDTEGARRYEREAVKRKK
jgi:tetratricopeptide (TPR) repeat protein